MLWCVRACHVRIAPSTDFWPRWPFPSFITKSCAFSNNCWAGHDEQSDDCILQHRHCGFVGGSRSERSKFVSELSHFTVLNHIKVISKVHVVWPHPFNCPCLRSVAARAGSVHLMFSMDRKGGARPRPKQHHPVPQGPPFSIKCWLSTGSPQSIPIKTAPKYTNPSRLFYHTTHTRTHLISCVGGVTPRHRNHICFKPSSTSIRP